jgi:hypothetical protein
MCFALALAYRVMAFSARREQVFRQNGTPPIPGRIFSEHRKCGAHASWSVYGPVWQDPEMRDILVTPTLNRCRSPATCTMAIQLSTEWFCDVGNLQVSPSIGLQNRCRNIEAFASEPEGWFLSRAENRSEHFRCYFAMGKIRGTARMRRHTSVHRAPTKYFSNSFVFKTEIEKERLPRDITPVLSAGASGSNPDAPTTKLLN